MKLLCIKDVVMNDGSVPFIAGVSYEFTMNADGTISRFNDNCLYKFMACGPVAWCVYFKYVLERV